MKAYLWVASATTQYIKMQVTIEDYSVTLSKIDCLFAQPKEMFQIAENYIVAKYPMVLCMEDDILYQC